MNERGDRSKVTIIAAIVILVVVASAVVFVLLLRPANDEYNNTIPAVMGLLTMITGAVPALLALLRSDQTKKTADETKTIVDQIIHPDETE